jgi:outer membrane protein assembly factor BamE (lipoprotein component of BamABCDE complex)
MHSMIKTSTLIFIAILLVCSCGYQSLGRVSTNYKAHKDYASLEMIYKHLGQGMKRTKVENLLGKPGYSPIDGQYYYSSDREEYPEGSATNQIKVPVGLVVDYRNQQGELTDELQTFWLGPIGE